MSKIRDRILRGEPATGTVEELGEWLVESIEAWTDEERAEMRRELDQGLKPHPRRNRIQ
jgi:hypothetical protein